MQSATLDLQLAAIEVPRPRLWPAVGGARPVLLGNYHGFMPRVLQLIRNSPTASAMLGRKAAFVAGEGFKVDAVRLPNVARFFQRVATTGRHRTAYKLLKRMAKDLARLRGVALQVIWSPDGQHIAELYHQRFETVAPGPMNEDEEVTCYYLCRDWSNTARFPVQRLPAFDPAKAKDEPVQLYYYYDDEPGQEYFPVLDFQAGLNYMELEGLLGEYHPTNVASRFSGSTMVAINKGPVDTTDPADQSRTLTAKEQRDAFTRDFNKRFRGPKGEQIMFLWGDGTDKAAKDMLQVVPLAAATNTDLFTGLAELAQQAILSAGQVTSPVVVGLPGDGTLGGNGAELREAYELYYNTVCRPDQLTLLDIFRELLGYVVGVSFEGEPSDAPWLDITTTLPVKFTFSEQTLELICTDDELRAMIDLKPLPAGARPAAPPANAPAPAPAGPPVAAAA